jgi:PadR family transcriptional regulator, regulatory protein PadR
MTHSLVQVAMALLDRPDEKRWGYDVAKQAGVRSGVLYPMLSRMLDEGWLTDGWEDPAAITKRRPPRRYYELTDEGRQQLAGVVRAAQRDVRFTGILRAWSS